MILDIKILTNNDFNMVPDKLKGVTPAATLIYLITFSKIKHRLVCALFIGKTLL